jgi:hypothetical protein
MTLTIWPHGWSFQTFLLGLAVFIVGAIVGCWTGVHMYNTGWDDGYGYAKYLYSTPEHPQHAETHHHLGSAS